jgi:hypothetical protein
VNALTKVAAVEVAKDNISVNSLAFAAIDIAGDVSCSGVIPWLSRKRGS